MGESTHFGGTQPPQTPVSDTDASTARFDCPAEAFALSELFERVPDLRVELDTAVASPTDHSLLVVRADGRERTIDAALRASPTIETAERFDDRADEDEWTYRVTWKDTPRQLIRRLIAADVTLLSARGRSGRWEFRLLAADRAGIANAYDIMDELGCATECRRISTFDGGESNRSPLTDEQREALAESFGMGYYDIPRDVTAEEVAATLDISHQALSERLRRAYRQLVETELAVEERHS